MQTLDCGRLPMGRASFARRNRTNERRSGFSPRPRSGLREPRPDAARGFRFPRGPHREANLHAIGFMTIYWRRAYA